MLKTRIDFNLQHFINNNLIQYYIQLIKEMTAKANTIKQIKINQKFKTDHKNRDYVPYYLDLKLFTKVTIEGRSFQLHNSTQKQGKQVQSQFFDPKIEQEYLLQKSLSHQYIVKIYNKRYVKKKAYFLQQYFSCFLSQYQLQDLNFQSRIKIFNSIGKGVLEMYNHQICHRALCPSNISVNYRNMDEPIVKINNFYHALQLKNKKSIVEQPIGKDIIKLESNQFSAPEIRNYQKHGLPADIWSLGAILNYLLYETMENIWIQQQQVKIEVPQGTPDWLIQLFRLTLHYNPSKRYCINTVLQIIKVSFKCKDVLAKYLPIGKNKLKFNKKQSKTSYQI